MAKLSLKKTPRKNFTGVLNGVRYVDGIAKLPGSITNHEGVILYHKKCYEAELIEVGEIEDGASKIQANAKQGNPAEIPSNSEPDGTGSAKASSDNGEGSDDDSTGGEGSQDNGSGQEDSGADQKLKQVLAQLDHSNDEHWTEAGKPSIQAVSAMLGSGKVTRKEIDSVAGDLKREEKKSD